ncbi:biopolymer transporter ExbD [Siphonobacter sp. SORGH_AS_1065]|uniref:ExbD/TolR family protein n=1 Tax=Siphonobacter sp. SORGH_AS_1065 TaxID=3041795 RepID=UPI002786BE4C|nr:biopolymer transporter ExbD [Siphonobacter sp. SORGH_AS_1065]MDQ1087840.1 biopolymer transport protein ExbD [Siphonobacter sp. SORGH_AS_1065]
MAEIAQGGGNDKGGKVRSKKVSTRVDMTPMVDLGFLLITFFLLTTTLQKPVTMFLGMPAKDQDEKQKQTSPIKESEAITVLLSKKDGEDTVYWYQGTGKDVATTQVEKTSFAASGGLRDVLRRKKAEIGDKFFVVIKSKDEASYKSLVDVLDEMAISEIDKYGITDINLNDIKIIDKAEAGK